MSSLRKSLFIEKIPQHPEYKTCDPNEKALTKTNCKTVFPIAEQLKSQLRERYQKEYDLYLDQLVSQFKYQFKYNLINLLNN